MKKEKVSFTVDRDLYLWFKLHVKDERTSMSALVNKYIMDLKNSRESRPKNLLKTNHGERLGDYNFGANLEELCFELASDDIEKEAVSRINSSIRRNMPYITMNHFESFTEHFENSHTAKIGIRLIYSIPNLGVANETIEVILRVAG